MANQLIGKDFTPPDVRGKVTGQAKYAEDFRAEGMLFCRLLTSPMPHARVRSIDASEALAMDGVVAVLTADDVPEVPSPRDPILTNTPHFIGEPILAVAAVDETTAQNAIDTIKLDLERLPFTVNPLQSLRPKGPDARLQGNTMVPLEGVKRVKWTREDFAAVTDGELPMGEPGLKWSFGDVEGGFSSAKVVLDETFVTASNSHHCMEPRSAMAYWDNGKCYLYGSSQSQSFVHPGLARLLGIEPDKLVYVAENCGGGFGSKGGPYPLQVLPALMAKKTGRPVMMRINRAEEYFIGQARAGFQGRIKIGFREDGRVLAIDLCIVQENGPNSGFGDWTSAADAVSLVYTPEAMRFRGVSVLTNTPPRTAQRGPGQNQIAIAVEPLLDKAARELGIDQVAIRRINAPGHDAKYGGERRPITSAYLGEALDQGAERFNWEQRRARSGERRGSKVIGIGVGQAFHSAGSNGFDGLVRITPEGKLHIHTGVGNLGTYSYAGTSRIAAEVLKCKWENCVIERGDSRSNLPWNFGQFGSNTSFTMTRTNFAAATDAVQKLKEIAALDFGGSPDDYDIGNEIVFLKSNPSRRLTYAAAAQRAIELGGKFSGQEVAEDLNPWRRQRQHGEERDRAGARGWIHPDRARSGDGQVRDPRLLGRCRLRNGHSSDGSRRANQERRGDGIRTGNARAPDLRPRMGLAALGRTVPGQARVLSGRTPRDGFGCRRSPRPAKPSGREGNRGAANGVRGGGARLRYLGCARWSLLQPDTGRTRHDHQCGVGTPAVP